MQQPTSARARGACDALGGVGTLGEGWGKGAASWPPRSTHIGAGDTPASASTVEATRWLCAREVAPGQRTSGWETHPPRALLRPRGGARDRGECHELRAVEHERGGRRVRVRCDRRSGDTSVPRDAAPAYGCMSQMYRTTRGLLGRAQACVRAVHMIYSTRYAFG